MDTSVSFKNVSVHATTCTPVKIQNQGQLCGFVAWDLRSPRTLHFHCALPSPFGLCMATSPPPPYYCSLTLAPFSDSLGKSHCFSPTLSNGICQLMVLACQVIFFPRRFKISNSNHTPTSFLVWFANMPAPADFPNNWMRFVLL